MPKTMTLRLTDDLAADLEAVARVDDLSVSEVVRVAITERIQRRRADKEFQQRLKRTVEEQQRVLARLAR
jgi:predicted transcriptional regulator